MKRFIENAITILQGYYDVLELSPVINIDQNSQRDDLGWVLVYTIRENAAPNNNWKIFHHRLLAEQCNLFEEPRSTTTRARRASEGDDDYRFIDGDTFAMELSSGLYYESFTLGQTSYSIRFEDINGVCKEKKVCVLGMVTEEKLDVLHHRYSVINICFGAKD